MLRGFISLPSAQCSLFCAESYILLYILSNTTERTVLILISFQSFLESLAEQTGSFYLLPSHKGNLEN